MHQRGSMPLSTIVVVMGLLTASFGFLAQSRKNRTHDWPMYGGDAAGSHYSELRQIDKENVHRLQVAWTYRSGDKRDDNRSQIQCNPIIIDGVLYGTSPQLKVFALNGATGENFWT